MNPGSPSTNGGAAITFAGVTKRYRGHLALNDLSLRVAKGCVFGLLGPNGAGKTTTLRLITGVLGPDAGTVTVLDEIPGVARARVGFLPEGKRPLSTHARVGISGVFRTAQGNEWTRCSAQRDACIRALRHR